jgi:hypothetical protein
MGVATIALTAGAAGSLGFFLLACYRNHSPPILVILIGAWVLAPFVALFFSGFAVARRAPRMMATWGVVTAVVSLGSLVVYAIDAVSPLASKAAAVFVVTPVAGWVVIVIAALLALRSR